MAVEGSSALMKELRGRIARVAASALTTSRRSSKEGSQHIIRRQSTMSLAAGTRFGPYEIPGPLGAGGMGEVYRAKDTRLSREVAIEVAIKVLQNPIMLARDGDFCVYGYARPANELYLAQGVR